MPTLFVEPYESSVLVMPKNVTFSPYSEEFALLF